MKRIPIVSILIVLSLLQLTFARTQWHTTKLYNRWGYCQLESSKLNITVNGFYLDIEEEAVIKTVGDVYYEEDRKTLEIIGNFKLAPGSIVRSLLLWNGDDILKAKLLDKNKADSTMNDIVNNTAKDPMLVKYEGNNNYSFRIYPVEIGYSRKLRMRYSIPLKTINGGFRFNVTPAFAYGCDYNPSTIPVTFTKADGDTTQYKLEQRYNKKSIQFNVTYLIPTEDFVPTGSYTYVSSAGTYVYKEDPAVSILPDSTINGKAFSCKIDSTEKEGCYTAIYSKTPDSLKAMIEKAVIPKYSIEAKIMSDNNGYITTLPENGAYTIYMKSQTPWDQNIYWYVYDNDGNELMNYVEKFGITSDSVDTSRIISNEDSNSDLPLIWAGNYTLVEGLGDLGGAFGFVDSKMSLLALERDTLPDSLVDQYKYDGVPLLLPEEILADLTDIYIPSENIIIESTDLQIAVKDAIKNVMMNIMSGNILKIDITGLNLKEMNIGIYDMRGRLIKSFINQRVNGHSIELKLPSSVKGMFIVKVKSGNVNFARKLIRK